MYRRFILPRITNTVLKINTFIETQNIERLKGHAPCFLLVPLFHTTETKKEEGIVTFFRSGGIQTDPREYARQRYLTRGELGRVD